MPPFDGWYQGLRPSARCHGRSARRGRRGYAADPDDGHGQPAAAMYMREGDEHVAFQLHVLAVTPGGVSHVVAFLDTTLFEEFGLPMALAAGSSP